MSPRSTFLGWLAAALLAASVAHAEGARIAVASAPPSVTSATRHSFEKAIERDVEAQTERVPEGYTLEPRLLELRRYTDGDPKRPMFVCVAELDLVEDSDGSRSWRYARASATTTTANEARSQRRRRGCRDDACCGDDASAGASAARSKSAGREPLKIGCRIRRLGRRRRGHAAEDAEVTCGSLTRLRPPPGLVSLCNFPPSSLTIDCEIASPSSFWPPLRNSAGRGCAVVARARAGAAHLEHDPRRLVRQANAERAPMAGAPAAFSSACTSKFNMT